jgi:hypothetical protein
LLTYDASDAQRHFNAFESKQDLPANAGRKLRLCANDYLFIHPLHQITSYEKATDCYRCTSWPKERMGYAMADPFAHPLVLIPSFFTKASLPTQGEAE